MEFSRNKLISFLSVIIVLLGVVGLLERMLIPITPFTGPDSVGYLGVAFRYMTNGVFGGIAERSYFYPGFLTLIIRKSKNVENIVLFQRVFSIFSIFLFYNILKLIHFNFGLHQFDRYKIHTPITLFFSMLILFSPSQAIFEQCTHPEALTLPMVLVVVYSMLHLYASIARQKMLGIFAWSFICIISNYFLYVMQPRMLLGCLFLYFIMLVFLMLNRKILLKFLIFLIPISGIAYINNSPMIQAYPYPEAVDCVKYGAIFYYNLNTISPLLKKDLNDPDFKKINKSYLRRILEDYEESKKPKYIKYATGRARTLGYNTDYLSNTYSFLVGQEKNNFIAVTSIYKYYIKLALTVNPLGLVSKVLKEFTSYYTGGLFFQTYVPPNTYNMWKDSLDIIGTWPEVIAGNSVYTAYTQQLEAAISSGYIGYHRLARFWSFIYNLMNFAFLPLLIISLIAIFYDLIQKSESSKLGLLVLLMICYHCFVTLTISIGASTTYERYIFDMFPASLLVFTNSFIYVLFFLWIKVKNNKFQRQALKVSS